MAYIYIASQPDQHTLTHHMQQTLQKFGIAAWIKDSDIDWEKPNYATVLHSVIDSASVFIFLESGVTLDPPEYLGDVIRAKRSGKPIFFIKSAKEFHLLLPQIRALMPVSSNIAPLPVIRLVSDEYDESKPPFRLRPGWFEIILAVLLFVLMLVIVLSLRG